MLTQITTNFSCLAIVAMMTSYQINHPKFDWEVTDKLTELRNFKEECNILFKDWPYKKPHPKEQAGLGINWLGQRATMTLKANRSSKKEPKEVYDALKNIFRPESNATMSKFQFRSLKQKSDQNVDFFLADLRLALPECQYPTDMENDILKDQFIFGVNNKEIQDSLLRDIKKTDTIDTCLTAVRRVGFQIAQRKFLGISAKCKYDEIKQNPRHRSKSHKSGKREISQVTE